MKDSSVSRAAAIKAIAAVPAVALAAAAAISAPADAAGASKAAVKYQDKPKNGQKCADCRFYRANKDPKKRGTCSIVQGSISPNGWCVSFAKKQGVIRGTVANHRASASCVAGDHPSTGSG